jgi:hypothetical protein
VKDLPPFQNPKSKIEMGGEICIFYPAVAAIQEQKNIPAGTPALRNPIPKIAVPLLVFLRLRIQGKI